LILSRILSFQKMARTAHIPFQFRAQNQY